MKRIKFLCITDVPSSIITWQTIPAATTKINYIISALNKAGYAVDVITAANAAGGRLAWISAKTLTIGVNTITSFGTISFPWRKITRRISSRMVTRSLNKFLYKNIREGDTVIAYHSPRYAGMLTRLRQSREFVLIGEIEEIYQDVRSMGDKYNEEEMSFVAACDKYIFPTDMLNEILNGDGKKESEIIHGLYNVEPDRGEMFDDSKVHVVYAGTFDPRKGGAAAAAAAAYLPENYRIHILGFGTDEQIENIKRIVADINAESKATITYDGLIKGEQFIRFIQKCEIGLSTQNPEAEFNATSFPSKILTYLSNGLKVVTVDIPAIRRSGVGSHLFYYPQQTPQAIADAILHAHEASNYDGRALLRQLDKKFTEDLKDFIS